MTSHCWQEKDAGMAHHRPLDEKLWNNIRNSLVLNVGQAVYFWRDNKCWTGPGIIFNVHKDAASIAQAGMIKTADRCQVRATSISRTIVDDEPALPGENNGTVIDSGKERERRRR